MSCKSNSILVILRFPVFSLHVFHEVLVNRVSLHSFLFPGKLIRLFRVVHQWCQLNLIDNFILTTRPSCDKTIFAMQKILLAPGLLDNLYVC